MEDDFGVTKFEIVPLSNASREYGNLPRVSSSYSACLHEMALNNTDICLGPTWSTQERRYEFGHFGAAFSATVHDDHFKFASAPKAKLVRSYFWPLLVWTAGTDGSGVYVDLNDDDAWALLYGRNFAIWLAIVVSLLWSGFILFVIEGDTNNESFPQKQDQGETILRSLFNSMQAYLGMGDYRHTPETHGGRFIMLTTSLSVLIIITTYTGLITSGMVATDVGGGQYVIFATPSLGCVGLSDAVCFLTAATPRRTVAVGGQAHNVK